MTMRPTISSVTESLLNPAGRFRTLDRIIPETDACGTPRLTVTGHSIDFHATVGRTRSILQIPCMWNDTATAKALSDALRTRPAGTDFIATARYMEAEMVVFDHSAKPRLTDIIVEEAPEGLPIETFLRLNSGGRGRNRIRALLEGLASLHATMRSHDIVHGNMRNRNITVSDNGRITLSGYLHPYERAAGTDRKALLRYALTAYVAACEPDAYIHRDDRFSEYLRLQFEFGRNEDMADAVKVAFDRNIYPDDLTTAAHLHAIASAPFRPLQLLLDLSVQNNDAAPIRITSRPAPSAPVFPQTGSADIDFSRCDFVGELADTLIRYMSGGEWGFADRYGRPAAGEKRFTAAEDFYEGRAAVKEVSGWGLIDRCGRNVMPTVYETLEWYGAEGVAAACSEGLWRIFDRNGKCLCAESYDWIAAPSEGMLIVRRDGKYGFIDLSGRRITQLKYDEAYSFAHGRALVARDGQQYFIDMKGRRIP